MKTALTLFRSKWPSVLTLASLVFFARAWLIEVWGSPLPFWDEWDAEAFGLYRPFLNGSLRFGDLVAAHNEHRMLLTRLADLGLLAAFGDWSVWRELLLNAVLHAASAAVLFAFFWPHLTHRTRVGFSVGLATLFCMTSGWQNALWGFQSAVYFGNLLAILAMVELVKASRLPAAGWIGGGCAILGLFSNGGGVLASFAVVISSLQIKLTQREKFGNTGLMAATGISLLGLALHVNAGNQAELHAHTFTQFLTTFGACLAWPHLEQSLAFIIIQLPLVGLCFWRFRQRIALSESEQIALTLGWFALLQSAAVAYGRGAGLIDSRPLSRYQDPLLLGVAAQLFAVLRIADECGRPGRLGALLWSGFVVVGLLLLMETNLSLHLPYKRAQDRANLALVRDYFSSKDDLVFRNDPRFKGPHPDPHSVERVLDDPFLRPILPLEIRASDNDPRVQRPRIVRYGATEAFLAAIAFLTTLVLTLMQKKDAPVIDVSQNSPTR